MASKKPADSRRKLYQLKIVLQGIEPSIWRRVLVGSHTKFPKLSRILETVMGWEGYHLHSFKVAGGRYGVPDPDWPESMMDEKHRKLGDTSSNEGFSFTYEYDFGDGWRHEVLIEKVMEPEKGKRYPICVAGERACPPEDCGGPWGYQDLLEALKDPRHEDHERMIEWAGADLDSEAFDRDAVNQALKKIR